MTTTESPSTGPTGVRPTRPTTGYALRIMASVASADVTEAARAAITATGAEIRRGATGADNGAVDWLVACASEAQQEAVRVELSAVAGLEVVAISDATFDLHLGGKVAVASRGAISDADDLAMAYTPGVGRVSTKIAAEPESVWRYTGRSNAVAVLSNGTAVLGLGDIGPEAAMPVMEGKAVLFKQFADVDAYPVCVRASGVDEVVAVGAAIAPTFGGINLEDIKAPECFDIEERLQAMLDIPVFHDD